MPAKIPNRFRSLVLEIIVLAILIPASVFLFTKLSDEPQKNRQEGVAVSTQSPSLTPENIPTPPTTPSVTTSSVPTPKLVESSITLTISSPDKSSTYKIPATKSLKVIEVMKIAEQQGLQLKTKDYGAPLGILIEEINGIKNDQKNQKYWTLYTNGKMSVLGASSATVSPNESVTWKFENTTL